jgi:S1-C subfamily serine protease
MDRSASGLSEYTMAKKKKKGNSGIIAVLVVIGGSIAALGFVAIVLVGVILWVYYGGATTKTELPQQAAVPPAFPGGPGFPPLDGPPGGHPGAGNFNPNPSHAFDPDTSPPVGKPSPAAAPAIMDAATREKVKKSAVYLFVAMGAGMGGEGSGFFAFEPGIVITNAHVVGMMNPGSTEPRNIDVVINSGGPGEKTVKGKVLGVDRVNDLAVIRVPSEGMPPPLPIETSASLSELQEVYVFGYPYGKMLGNNNNPTNKSNPSISIDKANVKSVAKHPNGAIRQIVITGDMQPGNSGGPVVDAAGRVIGVSVAIIKGTRINFAVPADCAIAMVNGRLAERSYGDRVVEGDQVKLPVKLQLLDPLKHVGSVEFEVWAGKPGDDRPPPADGKPMKKEGDGPKQRAKLAVSASNAEGNITLPALQPGEVHWVQAVLVSGSTRRFLTARALPTAQFPVNATPPPAEKQEPAPPPDAKPAPDAGAQPRQESAYMPMFSGPSRLGRWTELPLAAERRQLELIRR